MNPIDEIGERYIVDGHYPHDPFKRRASAARVRFRQRLCAMATDKVRHHVPRRGNEIVDCNLTVDVDASRVQDEAR
jgi:hypothetical protein